MLFLGHYVKIIHCLFVFESNVLFLRKPFVWIKSLSSGLQTASPPLFFSYRQRDARHENKQLSSNWCDLQVRHEWLKSVGDKQIHPLLEVWQFFFFLSFRNTVICLKPVELCLIIISYKYNFQFAPLIQKLLCLKAPEHHDMTGTHCWSF